MDKCPSVENTPVDYIFDWLPHPGVARHKAPPQYILKTSPVQPTFHQTTIASTTIIRNPIHTHSLLVQTSSVVVVLRIWNIREQFNTDDS